MRGLADSALGRFSGGAANRKEKTRERETRMSAAERNSLRRAPTVQNGHNSLSKSNHFARRNLLEAKRALQQMKRDVRSLFVPEGEWTWKKFGAQVRGKPGRLLRTLPRFHDAVLVSGCQRSGTTALTRLIAQSEGMTFRQAIGDDELDAALILSGVIAPPPQGRYCFQTTYLNERYREYLDVGRGYKLIWVLRNPCSVVFSMRYNWDRYAFDELFQACGSPTARAVPEHSSLKTRGLHRSKVGRACLSYIGKEKQAVTLKEALGDERMLIVEYDELVRRKHELLPLVYAYIELPYKPVYAEGLHEKSLEKSVLLRPGERRMIEETCGPVYDEVRRLALQAR
jgi:hypothetical protein